jgi:hypothetical protein
VLELDIDGEQVEVMLGPRPTVVARPSVQPDARLRSTGEAVSCLLMGSTAETDTFEHVSGDPRSTQLLITALGFGD